MPPQTSQHLPTRPSFYSPSPLPVINKLTKNSLSCHFALQWNSFTTVEEEFKQATDIKKMIHLLFQKVEAVHGRLFTGTALSLITASKEGISTSELEGLFFEVFFVRFLKYYPKTKRLKRLQILSLATRRFSRPSSKYSPPPQSPSQTTFLLFNLFAKIT
jgi:hypothetical protein